MLTSEETCLNCVPYRMFEIKHSGMFQMNDTLIPDINILDRRMIQFVFLTFKNITLPTVNLRIESYEKVT